MAVPWAALITFAPQLIDLSRELVKRARNTPPAPGRASDDPAALAERIAALEDNERRQAELVQRMAEQLAGMSAALVTLHKRQRRLIGALAVVGVIALSLLIMRLRGG